MCDKVKLLMKSNNPLSLLVQITPPSLRLTHIWMQQVEIKPRGRERIFYVPGNYMVPSSTEIEIRLHVQKLGVCLPFTIIHFLVCHYNHCDYVTHYWFCGNCTNLL